MLKAGFQTVRNWWLESIIASIAVCSLLITFYFANSSLRINLANMSWLMQRTELLEGNLSRMYLIARFVDSRKLYSEVITRSEFDHNEMIVTSYQEGISQSDWSMLSRPEAEEILSVNIINTFRKWSNKKPLSTMLDVYHLERLEQALQLERAKEYQRSIELLIQIMDYKLDPQLHGVVLLHMGFCHAFLGNIPLSQEYYARIISEYPDTELAVTAALLFRHLELILEERNKVAQLNIRERNKKLPLLLQCKELLNQKGMKKLANFDIAEEMLLQGYCEEEQGHKEIALSKYLEAIRVGGVSRISQDANRRLFLLGTAVPKGDLIKNAALHLNQQLKDSTLEAMKIQDQTNQIDSSRDALLTEISAETLQNLDERVNQITEAIKFMQIHQEDSIRTHQAMLHRQFPYLGAKAILMTSSGKRFQGEIISAPDELILRLRTLIGVIGIPQKDIASMIEDKND